MRKILLLALLISSTAVKAQTPLSFGFMDHLQQPGFGNDHFAYHPPDKKWSLSPYSAISTGLVFFNGGSAAFLSAPLGLQLNRRLNNNLYAFARASAAPVYMDFNRSFLSPDFNKAGQQSPFLHSNNFGMSSRAELGLLYVNDEKTFSISGSIGVERSSYPLFPLQQTEGSDLIRTRK
jgi:hypothetical protein